MSYGSDPEVLAASADLPCSCHWEVQSWLLQCLAPSLFQGSPCSHAPLGISTAPTSHDVAQGSLPRAQEKECWCLCSSLASTRPVFESRDRGDLFPQVTLALRKFLQLQRPAHEVPVDHKSLQALANCAGCCLSCCVPTKSGQQLQQQWNAMILSDDRQSWLLDTDTGHFHAVTTGPLSA